MSALEQQDTRRLYDGSSASWVRTSPSSLSDFTARRPILAMCEPVAGAQVLDLGCGEGYCARALRERGAARVDGLDVSGRMIDAARAQELHEALGGLHYHEGDAADLSDFESGRFDLVVAIFLFNYLTIEDMQRTMSEVRRVLTPQGRFIFSVPHPSFAHMRKPAPPFFFEVGEADYFSARNGWFSGRIWKRDGTSLEVRLCHKTFEDYFDALRVAGFKVLPRVKELHVTRELVDLDAEFFGPLVGTPLHLSMEVTR